MRLGRELVTGVHEVLTILNVLLVDSYRKVFRGIKFVLRSLIDFFIEFSKRNNNISS